MTFRLRPSIVIVGLTLVCFSPFTGAANTTSQSESHPEKAAASQEVRGEGGPSQFQVGPLPPVDVGMAVSGNSQKFMRFDHIANKIQRAGRSIENGEKDQQTERDARLNGAYGGINVDPERAPSEGRANKQGHSAVGVSLQTNF